jgi:hypothetical protein
MNKTIDHFEPEPWSWSGRSGSILLCATLLGTLTGCVGHEGRADGQAVMAQDDYVYYPQYEVYYSNNRHQYADQEGKAWVSHPLPFGVSEDALRASPSVKMDFHDPPANHRAEVVQKFPPNSMPPEAKPQPVDDLHDAP